MSIPKDAAKVRDEMAEKYGETTIPYTEEHPEESDVVFKRYGMRLHTQDCYQAGFDAGFKYQQEKVDEIEKQLCGIAPAKLIDRYYQSLKALRKFEQLKGALEENYTDDTIVRCEVTAGDIRAVLKCLYPNSNTTQGMTVFSNDLQHGMFQAELASRKAQTEQKEKPWWKRLFCKR